MSKVATVAGRLGICSPIAEVTFHKFDSYSDEVKRWIRLTARIRFIQLLWLAQKLNAGMKPEDAIVQIIKEHG